MIKGPIDSKKRQGCGCVLGECALTVPGVERRTSVMARWKYSGPRSARE